MRPNIAYLNEIERCVSWIAAWTIHHANHIRDSDEIKVGGHQTSSAALSTIMTALYSAVLRPQDRVAKPHTAPIFHAIHSRPTRRNLLRQEISALSCGEREGNISFECLLLPRKLACRSAHVGKSTLQIGGAAPLKPPIRDFSRERGTLPRNRTDTP